MALEHNNPRGDALEAMVAIEEQMGGLRRIAREIGGSGEGRMEAYERLAVIEESCKRFARAIESWWWMPGADGPERSTAYFILPPFRAPNDPVVLYLRSELAMLADRVTDNEDGTFTHAFMSPEVADDRA